jgi:hypothetical protein
MIFSNLAFSKPSVFELMNGSLAVEMIGHELYLTANIYHPNHMRRWKE